MSSFVPTRLLTVRQLLDRRGGSRSSLYVELQLDPDIPKPIKLGRRTYFVEQEVEDWLRKKVEQARSPNRRM